MDNLTVKELIDLVKEKQGSISRELKTYLNQLSGSDKHYFYVLYKKYWQKQRSLRIGNNFIPSAFLKSPKKHKQLGVVDYSDIIKDSCLADYSKKVKLICNPMDGGIGSSLLRIDYLKRIWKEIKRKGKPRLGAKGVDLYFELQAAGRRKSGGKNRAEEKVSITELKYLQIIKESRFYNKVIIEELVNNESLSSINEFLDNTVNLNDRLNRQPKKIKLNYRQLISKKKKISLSDRMILQSSFPTIDKKNTSLTLKRMAPGGHGQLGFIVLKEAVYRKPICAKKEVRAIYNGDGPNNFPDWFIVGYMVKKRIPIVMITSTKTSLDKKGGLIGLELSRAGLKPQILELAQAESQKQQELFAKIGLEGFNKKIYGQANKQYFNTNMALFNYSVLTPFLKDLCALIGEKRYSEIISPDLIRNEKVQNNNAYIQLEGALASALLNLAGFVKTSRNKKIKDLVKKHGIGNFLVIVNIGRNLRTKFFTPVKFAWDFWFYAYSDHFRINTKTFKLENLKPGSLPGFDLSWFYRDLENCIKAFGRASTVELDSLTVEGKVLMKNAKLAGCVHIKSETDAVIDLNSKRIGKHFEHKEGRLFLKNIKVLIKQGRNASQLKVSIDNF